MSEIGEADMPGDRSTSADLQMALLATLFCIGVAAVDFALSKVRAPHLALAVLIGQTALLGFLVGRYLPHSRWRWVFFCWVLAIVTLQLPIVAFSGSYTLPFVVARFVSAELGLLVFWAILGSGNWTWRIAGVMVAVPLLLGYLKLIGGGRSLSSGSFWNTLLIVQTCAVALVAAFCRWRGFRLRRIEARVSSHNGQIMRFNVADLLLWSLAVIPALFFLRNGGTALFDVTHNFSYALPVACCSAACVYVTFLVVLGDRSFVAGVTALFFVPTALGAALTYLANTAPAAMTTARLTQWSWRDHLWRLGWQLGPWGWTSWFLVSSLFLAACLVVFRFDGCRLVREP